MRPYQPAGIDLELQLNGATATQSDLYGSRYEWCRLRFFCVRLGTRKAPSQYGGKFVRSWNSVVTLPGKLRNSSNERCFWSDCHVHGGRKAEVLPIIIKRYVTFHLNFKRQRNKIFQNVEATMKCRGADEARRLRESIHLQVDVSHSYVNTCCSTNRRVYRLSRARSIAGIKPANLRPVRRT